MNGEEAVFALEAVKIGIDKGSCYLTGAVGAEVEEDNAVVSLYRAVLVDNGGDDKFIRYALVVASLHGACRVAVLNAFAVYESGIRFFDSVPCKISVHCIVASGNSRYFADAELGAFFLQLGYEALAGGDGNISAVHYAVDVYLFKGVLLCHFEKSEKVLYVTVNTAVGEKPHKVECGVVFLAVFHCVVESLDFKELAVLNGFCYFNEHLINNSACTYVGVTDFAVAHLSVGKSYIKSRSAYRCERTLGEKLVEVRSFGGIYGVSVCFLADAEAVHYT